MFVFLFFNFFCFLFSYFFIQASEVWVKELDIRIKQSRQRASVVQPSNIAPETVQIQLDKYCVSFVQLHELLKNECIDLRTAFVSLKNVFNLILY